MISRGDSNDSLKIEHYTHQARMIQRASKQAISSRLINLCVSCKVMYREVLFFSSLVLKVEMISNADRRRLREP